MNCDILKIVRGNDFATQMTITAHDAGGNVIEDFSLEDSTDVVVKYTLAGESHTIEAYDYDIEGTDITIQWSELALGKYGFEIEGKFNDYSWRSAARFIFQIVADNASANIPDGVLVDGVYKLSDWLRLLSGTGGGGKQVQADWTETDTESPAYIQNKPTLAPVATSGSYNDLTDKPAIPAAQIQSDWDQTDTSAKDYIKNKPTIPVVTGKADKVSGAVSGDFAGLDANGNLIDSGKKASDFATAEQGAKADTAVQDISGKQDVLVSGTNIKTINNESILGSGNITIGGSVDSVNGQTGVVVLDAEDVGALPDDTPIPEELTTVNVSVDGNVGTPSGSATISGNTISFEFSNLKGATGQQGQKGDTVILGDGEEYTLYNVIGQNTDGAMTQNASTIAFPNVADNGKSDLDIADEQGNALARFANGHFKTRHFDSEQTPTEGVSGGDLDIADENGNILVRFSNGGIKTKYFDSSRIRDKYLDGVKFSIVGDSISTFSGYIPSGYATFYPAGNLTNVEDTWWMKMANILGLSLLKNCSWSGSNVCGDSSSTTDASAGCSTKRIEDLKDGTTNPDIIIFYMGINDYYHSGYTLGNWTPKNAIPTEGVVSYFSDAYALAVYKMMTTYPNAEIYCCSLLECKTADTDYSYPVINTDGEYLLDYNKKIKEIAEGLGVNFIDVHSCGINYWNGQGDTLLDTTHPNVKGAEIIGKYIANIIYNITKKY